ncbi:MAG: tetratricopeptide repeat protein [Planctomycetes bacterium]|nr:tetratricopeptide repeat protein [Planctomycetota bacterium]
MPSDRTEKLQTLYQIGLNYFNEKEYERAIECWEGAIFFDPENFRAWTFMGLAHCEMGRMEEGIRLYRKALDIEPRYAKAWNLLGNAFRTTGELFRAVEAFEKANEIDPGNIAIAYNLAITYFEVMEYEKAIRLFHLVLEKEGTAGDILLDLSNSYYRIDRYQTADEYLERYLDLHPDTPERDRLLTARRLLRRFQIDDAQKPTTLTARRRVERAALLPADLEEPELSSDAKPEGAPGSPASPDA